MDVRGTPTPYSEDRCRIELTGNLVVNHDSWKSICWTAEKFDTNDMHDNAIDNPLIYIRRSGIYVVTASLGFAVNGNGCRRIRLRKGGITLAENAALPSPSYLCHVSIHNIEEFEVDESIHISCFQDSGGGLDIRSYYPSDCYFSAVRVSN